MRSQIMTQKQDGSQQRYLGELGPIAGVKYSYSLPGGCDQLSCVLQRPPDFRSPALDPGRKVFAVRGGGPIWAGILDEPTPTNGVWQITAHGCGTFGATAVAEYSGAWGSTTPDNAINAAISRGAVNWINPGIGAVSGLWTSQPQDSGSLMLDDLLNTITVPGGLTWQVARTPQGNVLSVFPIPTAVTHLLVVTNPVARTLGGDVNAICIRYQATPDTGGITATYADTFATDAASIAQHGRMEAFMDLSSVGPMLATDAQAVGNAVLTKYQRANFAGPFTALPGQLLTVGGQQADIGCFYTGSKPMVCRLIMLDQGWGGEVQPASVQFAVGAYEYDEDGLTATITPYQSVRSDFATLLSNAAAAARGRPYVTGTRTVYIRRGRKLIKKTVPTWHFKR